MKAIRMGRLQIGTVPRVVGCVTSVQTARKLAARQKLPFDIAEFRADLMGLERLEDGAQCRAMEKRGTPVLLTVRSRREGGNWSGTPAELHAFYGRLLSSVSAVDWEIQSEGFRAGVKAARDAGRITVASFHDFKKTPALSELKRVVRQGRKGGAQIVKIAAMIRAPGDIITLYELLREAEAGALCVIGMGPSGLATRIGLPCAGSCLAYGFIDAVAAPGQLSCQELKETLHRFGGYP